MNVSEDSNSSVNGTSMVQHEINDAIRSLFGAVYGLQWLIGFLGNLCAIWILRKLLKTSKTPTNVCMMNLSVADWIFCTFIIPITAEALCYRSGTPWKLWIAMGFLAQPVCKAFLMYQAVIVFVSIYTIVVMTVDRYLAVVHPITSMSYRTQKNTRRVLVCVWVCSVVISLPYLYAGELFGAQSEQCRINWSTFNDMFDMLPENFVLKFEAVFTFLFTYLIPLTAVVLLYYKILSALYQRQNSKFHSKKLLPDATPPASQSAKLRGVASKPSTSQFLHIDSKDSNNNGAVQKMTSTAGSEPGSSAASDDVPGQVLNQQALVARKRNEKTAKLVMIVVSVFAVCLLPFQIQFQIGAFDKENKLYKDYPMQSMIGLYTVYFMFFLNSIVNPFVYTFQCQPFQEALKRSLPKFILDKLKQLGDKKEESLGKAGINLVPVAGSTPSKV